MLINFLEKERKLSLIITILIAIGIFYVSSIQFGASSSTSGLGIKSLIYHFGAFFLLSFFLSAYSIRKTSLAPMVLTIGIVYAILDELHQYFVPTRYMSIGDVAVDTLGVASGLIVYLVLKKLKV